jgi:hypothetical protein
MDARTVASCWGQAWECTTTVGVEDSICRRLEKGRIGDVFPCDAVSCAATGRQTWTRGEGAARRSRQGRCRVVHAGEHLPNLPQPELWCRARMRQDNCCAATANYAMDGGRWRRRRQHRSALAVSWFARTPSRNIGTTGRKHADETHWRRSEDNFSWAIAHFACQGQANHTLDGVQSACRRTAARAPAPSPTA